MALRTSDFDRLYRRAERRERSRRFLVLASPSEKGATRWGLSVKARLGGAVVRNRIKRRLREILRGARRGGLPPGWDIVVQPLTAEVATGEFAALRDELCRLLERALRPKKNS
ncbi:MAG: ribonuclease P protein component [Candidatus Acidiferrales bacterium]